MLLLTLLTGCRENKEGYVTANPEPHTCLYTLTTSGTDTPWGLQTHIPAHDPPLQMSQHHYHAVLIPARVIHLNSNQDGCDSSLAAAPAAVLAGPGSKHNIVSPLTTADGHKMLESPSKNIHWLGAEYLGSLCVFVMLHCSPSGWNMCRNFIGSASLTGVPDV